MSSTSPPQAVSRLLIANLLGSIALGLFAMTVCLPSMAEWSGVFGASQAQVQLSFSAFVIGFGGAQLFYGPLSDIYGRRRVIVFGLSVAVVGSLLAMVSQSLTMLIGARLVQGAGVSAGIVVGRAMVQDFFAGPDKPRVMAYVGMVMGLCPPFATILGGQLHVLFGWRAAFAVAAALALVLAVSNAVLLPRAADEHHDRPHWLKDMLSAYGRVIRVPEFLGLCMILSMCTGSFYVFLAGFPVVLANYGVGPAEVGWYIAIVPLSYIAGNFTTTRLIRRVPEKRLMYAGQIVTLLGIGLAWLLAVNGIHSALAVTLPLFGLGFGHGLLMPSTLAGTVSVVPALAGAAAAVAGVMQQFFGGFSGYLVGLLDLGDARYLALMLFLFMLMSLFAQIVFPHHADLAAKHH